MSNELLQGIGAAIAIIRAVAWVINRIRNRKNGDSCSCGCDTCPLSQATKDACKKNEVIDNTARNREKQS